MVAIEPGRDLLVERRTREHVAGDLLQRELVERQIAVERVDDPIAPAPHVALGVGLVAVRIRIARRVEPLCGHPLAVARRGEKAIDDFLVRVARFVVHERIDVGRCRRQAGQVEADATNQGGPIRFRSRTEAFLFEPLQHEEIDFVSRPCTVADLGKRCAPGRDEGPVFLPFGALFDPPLNQVDFAGCQRAAGRHRRHAPGRIGGGNPPDDFALRGIARHDGEASAEVLFGVRLDVEAQLRPPAGLVGTVAGVALVRQQWPDVAVELDGLARSGILCVFRSRSLAREARDGKQHNRKSRCREAHGFPPGSGGLL